MATLLILQIQPPLADYLQPNDSAHSRQEMGFKARTHLLSSHDLFIKAVRLQNSLHYHHILTFSSGYPEQTMTVISSINSL